MAEAVEVAERMFTFQLTDGTLIENIPHSIISLTEVAANAIAGDEMGDNIVPIERGGPRDVELFIAYANLTKGTPETSREEMKKTDCQSEVDASFCRPLTHDEVISLSIFVDYLAFERLKNVLSKEVYLRLGQMTPAEIRKTFHLPDDLSQDEIDKMAKDENVWVDERYGV